MKRSDQNGMDRSLGAWLIRGSMWIEESGNSNAGQDSFTRILDKARGPDVPYQRLHVGPLGPVGHGSGSHLLLYSSPAIEHPPIIVGDWRFSYLML